MIRSTRIDNLSPTGGARYQATGTRATSGFNSLLNVSSSHSSHSTAVARGVSSFANDASLTAVFGEQLADLYDLVQRSQFVFGSPLGPIQVAQRSLHLPRFVYFGPHTSDVSLRLAFTAGLDHRDLRSTLALLHLVEQIALKPDLGQGLNLSFFPLVDVLGLASLAADRNLASVNWSQTNEPEINLLEQDARLSGYHGFVRLETARSHDVATVRLRFAPNDYPTPEVELVSSDDFEPFAVRWESDTGHPPVDGPLSIAGDLGVAPFELTLRLPAAWPAEQYREATASILKRFIVRYRGFLAYGQNL